MEKTSFQWTSTDQLDLKNIMESGQKNISDLLRQRFPSLTSKKCRERYENFFASYIKKQALSINDKKFILDNAVLYNYKWRAMGKKLEISANTIKNFYHGTMRRQRSFVTKLKMNSGINKKRKIDVSVSIDTRKFHILCSVAEEFYRLEEENSGGFNSHIHLYGYN